MIVAIIQTNCINTLIFLLNYVSMQEVNHVTFLCLFNYCGKFLTSRTASVLVEENIIIENKIAGITIYDRHLIRQIDSYIFISCYGFR
jgi:hypothetical protein